MYVRTCVCVYVCCIGGEQYDIVFRLITFNLVAMAARCVKWVDV